jgi:hypothetical protein
MDTILNKMYILSVRSSRPGWNRRRTTSTPHLRRLTSTPRDTCCRNTRPSRKVRWPPGRQDGRHAGKMAAMQARWLPCMQDGHHAGKMAAVQAIWPPCRPDGRRAGKMATVRVRWPPCRQDGRHGCKMDDIHHGADLLTKYGY